VLFSLERKVYYSKSGFCCQQFYYKV